MRPYSGKFVLSILLMLAAIPLAQFALFLTRDVVNRALLAVTEPADARWATVLSIVGLQAAFWLASALLATGREVLAWYVGMRSTFDLRLAFYRHLLRLPLSVFRRRPPGEHLFRATADIGSPWADPFDPGLTGVIVRQLPEMIGAFYTVAWSAALLWLIDPGVALILVAYIVPFFLVANWFYTQQRRAEFGVRSRAQDENTVLRDTIAAIRPAKTLGRLAWWRERYADFAIRTRRQQLRFLAWHIATNDAGLWTVRALLTYGTSGYLAFRVVQGQSTVGDWFATFALIESLQIPLEQCVRIWQQVRLQLVPAQRVLETLEQPREQDGVATPAALAGAVDFDDVQLRYDAGPVALDGLSLRVRPGERVALVGPSGAGKSSALAVLLRLYKVDAGVVRVDGLDIADLVQERWAREVGYVPQQTFLYDATIRQNVQWADPDATPARVEQACAAAGLMDLASKRPEGLDAPVGEGATVSGGERQRIGIARALLRSPRLFLLDEPTASLDRPTEAEVMETLRRVTTGTTTLIVAHRLRTVTFYDRIFVLDQGKLAEEGTHDRLLEAGGLYASLWRSQEAEP